MRLRKEKPKKMSKPKKLHFFLVALMVLSAVLVACGDPTATTAPNTTNAPTTTTTTKAAATTAPATTTQSAATTAPATTAVATTTAVPATTVATTAATDPYALQSIQALKDMPPNSPKGGKFTAISLAELAPDLHPYVSDGGFTDSWNDFAILAYGANLATYNYTSLKWELDATKDLKVTDGGKTFTWTLRSDLKWSDGSPITADDYQFGYDNAIKEDKTNPDNNFVSLNDLQRLVAVKSDSNAGTISITLDQFYPPDLALSYVTLVVPVPKKVWAGKTWYDPTSNPEILKPTVTSGPYMVKSWDPKSEGVLVPNPYWYRGKANFDEIILKGGSASIVLEAVKSGQADRAIKLPPQQADAARKDPSLTLYEWGAVNSGFRYMEYNTKRAPMDDKAFRQALNYAVDRDNLIKLAEVGLGTAQYSFIAPDSFFYNKDVKTYKYNVETAKKTLADAGYKLDGGKLVSKDGKPIELTVLFPISSTPRKLIATYLEQQFKQLGISVKVDGKEFNTFTKQVSAKDFDISLSAVGGGFPDPDGFRLRITTNGSGNYSQYSNPKVDELFKKGQSEADPAKRKAYYDEAQAIVTEDAPVMFLWAYTNFSPITKKIQGIVPAKGDRLDYNDAATRWYRLTS